MNIFLFPAIGAVVWFLVIVWDFRAKELTPALFWARLIVPAVVVVLCVVALVSILTKG